MEITQKQLDEMEIKLESRIGARFDEIERMIKQGDNETYHKMSLLLHTMSPSTKEAIESINERLAKYETGQSEIKNEMKETKELLKRYLPAIEAVSDVLAGNRTIKRIAQFLGYIGAIVAGIYSLKSFLR